MAEIHWIKLKTQMFDDEKIRLIEAMPESDLIIVIWIKLLLQAGKSNSNGDLMLFSDKPYSVEMLSTLFNRPLSKVKFAINILSELQLIEVTNNNVISIVNWEKHQNIIGLDNIREQNRLRQQKFRDKKKLLKSPKTSKKLDINNVTSRNDNAIETDTETDNRKKNNIYMTKDMFDLFWEKYPKKVEKKKAKEKFMKLNSELFETIMYALDYQMQSKQWKEGFIPNPTTWINGERWEDKMQEEVIRL